MAAISIRLGFFGLAAGLSVLVADVAGASAMTAATAPRVGIAQGGLSGVTHGGVDAFLGIPFAAAPVGPNRWRAPQSAASWHGDRNATAFGASCYQPISPQGFAAWTHEYVVPGGAASEDCLFLNVWRPVGRTGKLPVLVWIHGGGFSRGSGSVPVNNGAALAARGIVVVTVNYRLGVFGFLAHPELTREAGGAPPSNYGLQDQIAALRWIRDNIAAFGGDPASVTISGESAGSMSVHALVASPLAKGLFHRAIGESGLSSLAPPPPLDQAERTGVAFATEKGATSIAALRSMSTEQLASEAPNAGLRFLPVVDGVLLPRDPEAMIAEGSFSDVPMIVGQNSDENSAMSPYYGKGDAASFDALLSKSFGSKKADFESLYGGTNDAERIDAGKRLLNDRGLAQIWRWSRTRLVQGRQPVYGYLFTRAEPGPDAARYGAFHSAEMPYAFANLDTAPERNFTAADRRISAIMSAYWVNFVRTGDPNGKGLPAWPRLNLNDTAIQEIGERIQTLPLLDGKLAPTYQKYIADGGMPTMF